MDSGLVHSDAKKNVFFAPVFFESFFFLICLLIKYFIKMYSIDMNHMCISFGNGRFMIY